MLCIGLAPMDVGKMLPSTTYRFLVPQTRKSRETTLFSGLDPILFVACMWAEVTIVRFGVNRRFRSTASACLGLVRTERVALRAPVAGLDVIVRVLTIEHIYDY